jgi:hypothetical protein
VSVILARTASQALALVVIGVLRQCVVIEGTLEPVVAARVLLFAAGHI